MATKSTRSPAAAFTVDGSTNGASLHPTTLAAVPGTHRRCTGARFGMRLLVDENLSYRVAEQLSRAGHDVVRVSEVGLNDTDDDVIFPWALRERRRLNWGPAAVRFAAD